MWPRAQKHHDICGSPQQKAVSQNLVTKVTALTPPRLGSAMIPD
jgi:hypothetical protein